MAKLQSDGPNGNSSNAPVSCEFGRSQNVSLAMTDIITFVIGQLVISRLLWRTLTSKKDKDILNINLAVFHNLQYLMSVAHVVCLFVLPQMQLQMLSFYTVYAELGGPMNISFICLQRYVAVIHPTHYSLLKKYRCRELWALLVWLLCVPMAFASVFDGSEMSSVKDDLINSVVFIVMLSVTIINVQVSAKIVVTLKKSGPGREKLSPAKKRAFTIVRATSAITMCFYVPVALMQKFRTVNEYTFQCIITPVCILLLSAASIVHPLFYLSTQGNL